jgi:putative membrane protein
VKALLARVLVLAIAFLVVDAVMDTVTVNGGFFGALGLAVLYGIISGVIGTVLRFLTLPLVMITVGLFEFVINAVLLLLTDWLTDWIEIDGFFSALGAAVILSATSIVVALAVSLVIPKTRRS